MVTSSIKVQGILSYACVILFYFGLISLKVLNSIVLLGKSCQYVKEAKMEDKLFNPPPASAPGKPSSKSQNKCKPSQGGFGSLFIISVNHYLKNQLSELSMIIKITVEQRFQDQILLCSAVDF